MEESSLKSEGENENVKDKEYHSITWLDLMKYMIDTFCHTCYFVASVVTDLGCEILGSIEKSEEFNELRTILEKYPTVKFAALCCALTFIIPVVLFIIFAAFSIIIGILCFIFVEGIVIITGLMCLCACLSSLVLVVSVLFVSVGMCYITLRKLIYIEGRNR